MDTPVTLEIEFDFQEDVLAISVTNNEEKMFSTGMDKSVKIWDLKSVHTLLSKTC